MRIFFALTLAIAALVGCGGSEPAAKPAIGEPAPHAPDEGKGPPTDAGAR